MIRGSVAIGAFPALGDQADQDWTPVDDLAGLIRGLVYSPRESGKTFTIIGARVPYEQIVSWVRSYGYAFSLISPQEWARRVSQNPLNAASALSWGVVAQFGQGRVHAREGALELEIGVSGIRQAMNERAFHRMLDRMVDDGLLARPVES